MIRFPCLVCPPVLFIDLQDLIRFLISCSPFSLALSHPRALSVGPAPRPTHDLPPVCPRRSPGFPRFPLGPGNDGGSSSVPPARPWVYLSAFPLESGPHSGAQVPLGRRWLLAVLSFLTLDGGSLFSAAAAAAAAPPRAPSPRSFLSACQPGPRPSLSSESSCTPSSLQLALAWSGLAAGLFLPGPRRRRRQTSNFCPTLSTDLTISYSVSQTSLETRHPLYRSYLMSPSLFPSFLHSPSHPSGLPCHAPRPRSGSASLLPLPRAHQHGLPLYRC